MRKFLCISAAILTAAVGTVIVIAVYALLSFLVGICLVQMGVISASTTFFIFRFFEVDNYETVPMFVIALTTFSVSLSIECHQEQEGE